MFPTQRFLIFLLTILMLVACQQEPQIVEKVVEVEVTRIVEVERVVTQEASSATGGETTTVIQPEPVILAATGETLKQVQERGILNCGSNNGLPGFGYLDPETEEYTGFDADFCRAIAAAVLGDASQVNFVPVNSTTRFALLQSGEVDIVFRNTTVTLGRDTTFGINYGPITFYDGQGIMAPGTSGYTTLFDLQGATICVTGDTANESNLTATLESLQVSFTPAVYPDAESTLEAYKNGECDAFSSDQSSLATIRANELDNPTAHIILEAVLSKEPSAPLVRHGDDQWHDILDWVVYCTIQAEESGVSQGNVDDTLELTEDPVELNMLGITGELGQNLGLNPDFCYQVIKQVGNYGEIYNRNLGADTVLNLPRSLNRLYSQGGLLYAPPFR